MVIRLNFTEGHVKESLQRVWGFHDGVGVHSGMRNDGSILGLRILSRRVLMNKGRRQNEGGRCVQGGGNPVGGCCCNREVTIIRDKRRRPCLNSRRIWSSRGSRRSETRGTIASNLSIARGGTTVIGGRAACMADIVTLSARKDLIPGFFNRKSEPKTWRGRGSRAPAADA
jgi:hypothetical protein